MGGGVAAVSAAAGLQKRIPAVWRGGLMDSWGEIAAIVMVALLSIFMYRYATRAGHSK
jgi:hypothetical protein